MLIASVLLRQTDTMLLKRHGVLLSCALFFALMQHAVTQLPQLIGPVHLEGGGVDQAQVLLPDGLLIPRAVFLDLPERGQRPVLRGQRHRLPRSLLIWKSGDLHGTTARASENLAEIVRPGEGSDAGD